MPPGHATCKKDVLSQTAAERAMANMVRCLASGHYLAMPLRRCPSITAKTTPFVPCLRGSPQLPCLPHTGFSDSPTNSTHPSIFIGRYTHLSEHPKRCPPACLPCCFGAEPGIIAVIGNSYPRDHVTAACARMQPSQCVPPLDIWRKVLRHPACCRLPTARQ